MEWSRGEGEIWQMTNNQHGDSEHLACLTVLLRGLKEVLVKVLIRVGTQ